MGLRNRLGVQSLRLGELVCGNNDGLAGVFGGDGIALAHQLRTRLVRLLRGLVELGVELHAIDDDVGRAEGGAAQALSAGAQVLVVCVNVQGRCVVRLGKIAGPAAGIVGNDVVGRVVGGRACIKCLLVLVGLRPR